jgi:hypothetical protein
MNINSVSFPCKQQNIYFGKKADIKNQKSETKQTVFNKIPVAAKTLLAGSALALLLSNIPAKSLNPKGNLTIPFDSKNTSIAEISKTYNVDEDAITAYNNIQDNADVSEISEIKVPSSFDYLQNRIEEKQTELYSENLSEEDRKNTEKEIEALFKKQEEQNQIANVYSDGEFVYLNINISDDLPSDLKEKYKFGINIETLKKLFDIADGGIENNNELNVRDDAYGKYGNDNYKDYTQNWFHNGDVVKVPVSSIQKDGINLNGYYQE